MKEAESVKVNEKPRRGGSAPTPAPLYHPGPLIDGAAALDAALTGLRQRDAATIDAMLAAAGPPPLRLQPPGFAGLAAIIVSQQVSVASADAIFGRLQAAVQPMEAGPMLAASDDALRACGLSAAKVRTFRALSTQITEHGLDLARLGAYSAAEAHERLVAVKGIGPWTADIFLLSCLGHPDAWPVGDVALQEAARLALRLDTRPNARALEEIGERWRPWRAVAARLLWHYYRASKSARLGMAEG